MLMPPGAAVGPVAGAPPPAWSTPDAYFVSLPKLPTPDHLRKSVAKSSLRASASSEPPDDMTDQSVSLPLLPLDSPLFPLPMINLCDRP